MNPRNHKYTTKRYAPRRRISIYTASHIFILSMLLCVCKNVVIAQSAFLTGHWKGFYIIVDESLNKSITYPIEMKLLEKNNVVRGSSFDYIRDQRTYCVMELNGTIDNKKITLTSNQFRLKKNNKNFVHLLADYDLNVIDNYTLNGTISLKNNVLDPSSIVTIYLTKTDDLTSNSDLYFYNLPEKKNYEDYLSINKKLTKELNKPDAQNITKKPQTRTVDTKIIEPPKVKINTSKINDTPTILATKPSVIILRDSSMNAPLQQTPPHSQLQNLAQQNSVQANTLPPSTEALSNEDSIIESFLNQSAMILSLKDKYKKSNTLTAYQKLRLQYNASQRLAKSEDYIIELGDDETFLILSNAAPHQSDTIALFYDDKPIADNIVIRRESSVIKLITSKEISDIAFIPTGYDANNKDHNITLRILFKTFKPQNEYEFKIQLKDKTIAPFKIYVNPDLID